MTKLCFFSVLCLVIFKAEAQDVSALAIGDSLFGLGNYSKAIEYYKKSNKAYGQQLKIARAYEAMGNNTKSLPYYKNAISLNNDGLLAKYRYAKLLRTIGKLDQADSLFSKLAKENPKNANLVYELGVTKQKNKDSTAVSLFMQAHFLDRTHQNALYKLAEHFTIKRNFVAAIANIDKGLELAPESTRFINLRALVAFHSKSHHEAVKQYEHLLTFGQSNEQLHENLGVSYTNTNQIEKAIDQFKILINEYNDKNYSWHFAIGKAFAALHYYEKAIRHIELSIALQEVTFENEYLSLANIYKRKKDFKMVFEMVGNALHENPVSDLLRYQYAVAADNYFEDKAIICSYYEAYLKKHGKNGAYRLLASQRLSDIKKELHFKGD